MKPIYIYVSIDEENSQGIKYPIYEEVPLDEMMSNEIFTDALVDLGWSQPKAHEFDDFASKLLD